ncbi:MULTISPECIES: hypothetical protein [Flavobacterium]|uniref:Uncharacterized protein n=1 Tax=Flavobacterium jumunjinense TaxID=998845 RepID=A0ABV5GK71_9FLAO|nr:MULTISPECIES: hypothetical protein [Flavobacterium]
MKKTIRIIFILISFLSIGQSKIDSLFTIGDSKFEEKDYVKAREVYNNIKSQLPKETSDYKYVADQIAMIYFFERDNLRKQEKYEESNKYLNEFLKYIDDEKEYIRPFWNDEKKYFIIKTIIQNCFATNNYQKAREYQNILYEAYKQKKLPEGINQNYSFEMFKWEDKNIWGYEWFAELGDEESKGSFSKIVYYVYSTDENGEDKVELYRLHVLKVHKIEEKMPDYVLTKRLAKATNEVSGTLWSYTYNSPIEYEKLKKDVEEVLKGNYKVQTSGNN